MICTGTMLKIGFIFTFHRQEILTRSIKIMGYPATHVHLAQFCYDQRPEKEGRQDQTTARQLHRPLLGYRRWSLWI